MFCFFFQAEDGIRDTSVTGVQTCALPILNEAFPARHFDANVRGRIRARRMDVALVARRRNRASACNLCRRCDRSEERRVGKESSYRTRPKHESKDRIEGSDAVV